MKRWGGRALIVAILISPFFAPPATALINERPATVWGHTFANPVPVKTLNDTTVGANNTDAKSKFDVTFNNFPQWAQKDIQSAVDIWAANFQSNVPITVEATWSRSTVYGLLGSARPGNYFNSFPNSPDATLWYPSALANALAGKDLDKVNPEIVIQVNSAAPWDTRNDGTPSQSEYDLKSVFIHEIGHGLGFLSTDSYNPYFGLGTIDQPTAFDAYLLLDDGRRLSDLPSPSTELGKALVNNLSWSGPNGIAANGGVRPKIYTPANYENGSSVSHLDEATFANAGVNSVMTPNLSAGEVFTQPGPLLLAMMQDLRLKPPAGIAIGLPNQVRNLQVLVGDSSAIVTFDPPSNARTAQISNYLIKNLKTGQSLKTTTSPFVFKNLKNGTPYSFSVTALNDNGPSDEAISEEVIPTPSWKSTVIDSANDAKYLVTSTFNNQPFIAYIDSKFGRLRSATYTGKVWKRITLDGGGGSAGRSNHKLGGHLSICTTGVGSKQVLHLFYGDLVDHDLRHATITPKTSTFEVVDGNAESIQPYDQTNRTRTGSDVSVASSCVATPTSLQVFYRDESQGILLGAVKKTNKWSYELIDGDRKTDGRTTGDVAFHLKAILSGITTYLIYDSVLVINQRKEATSGEIRIASRDGTIANSWIYESINAAKTSASVLGYGVELATVNGKVVRAWLGALNTTLPNPNQIMVQNGTDEIRTFTVPKFGVPNSPININGNTISVSCQNRLCAVDMNTKRVTLISGWQNDEPIQNGWLKINGVRYLIAGINKQLVTLRG